MESSCISAITIAFIVPHSPIKCIFIQFAKFLRQDRTYVSFEIFVQKKNIHYLQPELIPGCSEVLPNGKRDTPADVLFVGRHIGAARLRHLYSCVSALPWKPEKSQDERNLIFLRQLDIFYFLSLLSSLVAREFQNCTTMHFQKLCIQFFSF